MIITDFRGAQNKLLRATTLIVSIMVICEAEMVTPGWCRMHDVKFITVEDITHHWLQLSND